MKSDEDWPEQPIRRPSGGNWAGWPRVLADRELPAAEAASIRGCPLCPAHKDHEFFRCDLLDVPLCVGCHEELHHFATERGRREDVVVRAVERYTGKPWAECKVVLLREALRAFEAAQGEHTGEAGAYVDEMVRWLTQVLARAEAELPPETSGCRLQE